MAKRPKKKRSKKKGPPPQQKVEKKRSFSMQQIFVFVIGILVILSMSIGYLLSALR